MKSKVNKRDAFWYKTLSQKGKSEWESLSCKLAEDVREYYYKDHRMNPERFEHRFNLVAPTMTKKRHKLQKL